MTRLRRLYALFACLAVLASGATVFAGSTGSIASATFAATESCQHCHDCDGMPCNQAVDCTAPCAAAFPALAAAPVEPRRPVTEASLSVLDIAALAGERPPPDPFPPKI